MHGCCQQITGVIHKSLLPSVQRIVMLVLPVSPKLYADCKEGCPSPSPSCAGSTGPQEGKGLNTGSGNLAIAEKVKLAC